MADHKARLYRAAAGLAIGAMAFTGLAAAGGSLVAQGAATQVVAAGSVAPAAAAGAVVLGSAAPVSAAVDTATKSIPIGTVVRIILGWSQSTWNSCKAAVK